MKTFQALSARQRFDKKGKEINVICSMSKSGKLTILSKLDCLILAFKKFGLR